MTTFEILAKNNQLSLTPEGKVVVTPLSRYEFQTYPLFDNMKTIEITQDEYIGMLLRTYQFTEDLKSVELFNREAFAQFLSRRRGG